MTDRYEFPAQDGSRRWCSLQPKPSGLRWFFDFDDGTWRLRTGKWDHGYVIYPRWRAFAPSLTRGAYHVRSGTLADCARALVEAVTK